MAAWNLRPTVSRSKTYATKKVNLPQITARCALFRWRFGRAHPTFHFNRHFSSFGGCVCSFAIFKINKQTNKRTNVIASKHCPIARGHHPHLPRACTIYYCCVCELRILLLCVGRMWVLVLTHTVTRDFIAGFILPKFKIELLSDVSEVVGPKASAPNSISKNLSPHPTPSCATTNYIPHRPTRGPAL